VGAVELRAHYITEDRGREIEFLMQRYRCDADTLIQAALECLMCYTSGLDLPVLTMTERERLIVLAHAHDLMLADTPDWQRRWRETLGLR
jgi:hypothetical protein